MKYFISICFAVLLAFTGSIFAEDTISPGKNTQILRYKFRQGETISVQVSHRALTETTINGTTQHVETATDSTKSWKITHVDKDG
ncbi:MAG: hypothetical protein HON07_09730, partial [Planctomycetaceae bacterium]|nr:hypothetical protein [Planctomycetaceae bacterium]